MNKKQWLLLGIIFVIVIIEIAVITSVMNKKIKADEEIKINACKRVLYEEDYIMVGCDKYFTNDKWYKDYIKVVDEYYQEINQ